MHKNFPNKFYFIDTFKKNNIDKLDFNTGIIFRNYKKKQSIYEIIKAKKYCKNKKIRFFLSNNFKLALKLNLDGCYIPSFNKSFKHLSYKTKSSFIILGSAHNITEIRQKEKQKVKIIFISSIFKKNKNYLGLHRFNFLSGLTKKRIVALGGISKKNIKRVNLLNCFGISGISFFK
tara:strand:- start:856 stop:1383 length:528 start_codon:yes stop_codon:yes gene_type:complete